MPDIDVSHVVGCELFSFSSKAKQYYIIAILTVYKHVF